MTAETMQDMEQAGAAAPKIVEQVIAQPSLAEAATATGENGCRGGGCGRATG